PPPQSSTLSLHDALPISIFLPEWPALAPDGTAPYTTVAHWWGGTFEYNGTVFSNEKRVAFLEYLDLPIQSRVQLEVAVCLAEHRSEEHTSELQSRGHLVC